MWKWVIIVLIMLSLVGSVMWAMPTRRQTHQAKLRARAKALGFQVQLVTLVAPRALGEAEAQEYRRAAYRLLRRDGGGRQRDALVPWQLFRVESLACEGLPAGWSWKHGERQLRPDQLAFLAQVLATMPEDVLGLESTPLHLSAFWDERGDEEALQQIRNGLEQLMEKRV